MAFKCSHELGRFPPDVTVNSREEQRQPASGGTQVLPTNHPPALGRTSFKGHIFYDSFIHSLNKQASFSHLR